MKSPNAFLTGVGLILLAIPLGYVNQVLGALVAFCGGYLIATFGTLAWDRRRNRR